MKALCFLSVSIVFPDSCYTYFQKISGFKLVKTEDCEEIKKILKENIRDFKNIDFDEYIRDVKHFQKNIQDYRDNNKIHCTKHWSFKKNIQDNGKMF